MVFLLKIVTGEEILAETKEELDRYILKNPVKIALTPQGMAMIPYLPLLKSDTVSVDKRNVVFAGEVEDELFSAYNSKFGTGIVLAGSSLKLE